MNVLDVIQQTGNIYRRKAATLGGEFSGPCPWCQGEDRFSIHPAKNHFVCRRCRKAGDSIEFVKMYYNKSYIEACKFLDIQPTMKFSSLDLGNPAGNEIKWQPREIVLQSRQWQQKAEAFLFEKFKYLLSPAGKIHRRWLNERGIKNETIKKARFGYNNASISFNNESWGVVCPTGKKSSTNAVWLPEGLIIPQFYNGKLIRLRIRQSNPDSLTRFIVVRGSANGYFDYDKHINRSGEFKNVWPWIITESDIDGWLLHQECSNFFKIFSIGNSSARPDLETHKFLKSNPGLVNLDNDEAGQTESLWWKKHYSNCKIWYSEKGKDPGEDFRAGINISNWIKKGLAKLGSPLNEKNVKKTISENFKNKIINKYKDIQNQKQGIIKKNSQENQLQAKECLHGNFCVSMKNSICLINKKHAYLQDLCPAGKWYRYKKGDVTEIILGPGMDR